MGDLGLGWGGLVDWGSGLVGWGGVVAVPSLGLWWVDSGSLIGDVSDEASLVVGVVGDDLSPAVGEGNTVLAGNNTVVILQSDKNQSSMDQKIGTQTYFGIDFRLGFVK